MGLKQEKWYLQTFIPPRSNRTIVGLKLGYGSAGEGVGGGQQSHHCGIETNFVVGLAGYETVRSNRTIVGLKLPNFTPRWGALIISSNRTIVGLKLGHSEHQVKGNHRQQSHHCGIETVDSFEITSPRHGSNRTIVGLKRSLTMPLTNGEYCSNRTIVGLKRNFLDSCPQFFEEAAIAPLWD